MENISDDFPPISGDLWNINQLTLYAKRDGVSTFIYPDYIDKSAYDPVRDKGDPKKDYGTVDFSGGRTALTLSYLVKEEVYYMYPGWELLLNINGVPAHDYERLSELNGEPPFEKVGVPIESR